MSAAGELRGAPGAGATTAETLLPVEANDDAGSASASASASALAALAARGGPDPRDLLGDLLVDPSEFDFDAAVAILLLAAGSSDPAASIRFEAPTGLAFAAADVLSVRRNESGYTLRNGLIGLTGPAGAMPRVYTEHAIAEHRRRTRDLADFLDLVAQRPLGCFAAAALKYRPHRIDEAARLKGDRDDPLRSMLVALTGHAIPIVAAAIGDELDVVLHHAGSFAWRPRSAERLAALLSDWLGEDVAVEQFAGRWLKLDASERSTLPISGRTGIGAYNQLGADAAIGAACWDAQSAISIRIGPLSLAVFESLMPGTAGLDALTKLATAYLDGAAGFSVNPVLAGAEIPPLTLGAESGPGALRLGWNSWLDTGTADRPDGHEAVFHGGAKRRPP